MLALTELRKALHKIPEPGFKEWKTQALLLEQLQAWPELSPVTFEHPGILLTYRGGEGPFRLFRADMDALPIPDETGCDFASEHPGFSHACGHDVHMTVLIGLIERVMRERPRQNLLFLFQPAEEGLGGAESILRSGVLDCYEIESAYALHVKGGMPVGTVATKPGRFFCKPQEFDVIFEGRGAHCAFPQSGADALAAAVLFMTALPPQLKLKFPATEPIVCHIGKFEAGKIRNAVADHAHLCGTTRSFTREAWAEINRILESTAAHAGAVYGVEARVEYLCTFDPVINNAQLYQRFRNLLPPDIRFEEAEEVMTGEDFGFYTTRYPGLLYWLGVGGHEDLHSSRFLPDAEAIDVGVKIMYRLATQND